MQLVILVCMLQSPVLAAAPLGVVTDPDDESQLHYNCMLGIIISDNFKFCSSYTYRLSTKC